MKRLTLTLTTLLLFAATVPAAASAATPPLLSQFCEPGAGAGQCRAPRGIAADPTSGEVYVTDSSNSRVNRFSAWGALLESWGWGVRDGSPEAQTCGPASTPPSTTCRAGISGGGAGQLATPKGIAIDSSGDVYLYESSIGYQCGPDPGCPDKKFSGNNRVQKFSPDGEFILAFGREVNLTKVAERKAQEANAEPLTVTPEQENICTAASGDICGRGVRGAGNGEFGAGPASNNDLDPYGSYIAVGLGDTIYVGGTERIQKFNPDGSFAGLLPDPDGALAGESVQSLAVDPSGNLYLSFLLSEQKGSKEDVLKLSPAGKVLATIPISSPQALAVDEGGQLYAFDREIFEGESNPRNHPSRLLIFNAAGSLTTTFGEGTLEHSNAIATSSACGLSSPDLFVANTNFEKSYIRAYGPAPDPTICPPPPAAPTVSAQYASSVGADAATLRAEVNPHFWPDTTYYVEYGIGKCSDGGCDKAQPLSPGSKLTATAVDRAIATNGVFLQGLIPSATYHYRFVATSSGGGPVRGVGGEVAVDGAEGAFHTFSPPVPSRTSCPNQAFRTGASAKLPDCRAYEMVSPVDKNGGDANTARFVGHILASTDGERLTYSSLRAFADPIAAPLQSQYLSARGTDGWSTESISPPRKLPALYPPGGVSQFKAFSEDLCQAWVVQDTDLALAPGAPVGVPSLYRRENCNAAPAYELLTTVQPPGGFETEAESNYYVDLMGRSTDGSHAVYRADAPLTPNACKTERIFQTYITSPEGPLRLVSSLPGNKANCTHSSAGLAQTPTYDFRPSSVYHAVSEDGETVFWSAGNEASPIKPNSGSVGRVVSPKLYVRTNATQLQSPLSSGECIDPDRACTLAVSEVSGSEFLAASASGDSALYNIDSELFEFDVEADESHAIAKVLTGVVGSSEDLSRVYFISTEDLSGEQQNSAGEQAEKGSPNLYLYDRGSGGFTFVARLSAFESIQGGGGLADLKLSPSLPAAREPEVRSSRLTPDGLHLAFTSTRPLTGYDSTDGASGQPDSEVFLYDVEAGGAGHLACISCNPSGARPRGAKVGQQQSEAVNWAAGLLPGWPDQFRASRLLATDGSHLFFESFDALVSADSNGRKDVYEWRRAADEDECHAQGAESYVQSAGGCLSLISSGRSSEDSSVLDASVSGADVFFTTNAGLLQQDPGLVDVYDAHVNGGYPPPPSPPAACEGEACQGPLGAPNDPTPASSTFQGAGNVKDKAAKKKHKKKQRQHKKNRRSQRANHERRAAR